MRKKNFFLAENAAGLQPRNGRLKNKGMVSQDPTLEMKHESNRYPECLKYPKPNPASYSQKSKVP